MVKVHPTALVESGAELDPGVEIGAHAYIGPKVFIGADTIIGARALVTGHTRLGRENHVHTNAVIGTDPQDKKYRGEPTELVIGDRNTIREFVTINVGTVQDQGCTRIGHDNWIMAYVHIAHDCVLGNQITLANCTQLGGHVVLGDWVTLGGFTGVHQFCRVGAHVMTAVGTTVLQDIPPFIMASGQGAEPHGLNVEGLRRRGFSAERIAQLKRVYRVLYRQGLGFEAAREQIEQWWQSERQAEPSAAGDRASLAGDPASLAGDPAGDPASLAGDPASLAGDLACMVEFLRSVTRGIIR